MSTRSFDLLGVDGTNPLGFLTALGTLVVLEESEEVGARLRWTRLHTWIPVLEGVTSPDEAELARIIAQALRGRPVSNADEEQRASAQRAMEAAVKTIKKKREEIRKRGLGRAERKEALERELRPLEEEFQSRRKEWLRALRQAVPQPELALGKRIDCTPEEYREHAEGFLSSARLTDRGALDLLAAFGSDACRTRNSQAIEATPFCFTKGSGHQYFLDTVRDVIARVDDGRVRKVLFEPWTYQDERLSMRWDPVEDKRYALLDSDPGPEGARTVWMANLLAYHALTLFPTVPTPRGLAVVGWNQEEDPPTFTWPLWEFPANLDVVRTLLQLPELTSSQPDRMLLRERGVVAAYRTQRISVGTGSNKKVNFTPARRV